MTRADIARAIHNRLGGLTHHEAAQLIDLVFDLMKETLGRGEKVKISGFGNWSPKDKHERPGRNPQTGEVIKIAARRVVTFKASDILKEGVNRRDTRAGADDASTEPARQSLRR